MEETENFRRFKELSNKYIHICEQKADQGTEKKTSEAQEERLSEIVRFTSLAEKTYLRTGVVDMEALEQGMRVAALKDGARHLGLLIARIGNGSMECPECDTIINNIGLRKKEVTTLLGETTVERLYCKCPGCNTHSFPKDRLLDIENTSFSPGVRRLMARCGARDSFARGEEDLLIYSGINVGEKDIERISEAIGADIKTRECHHRLKGAPKPPFERAPEHHVKGVVRSGDLMSPQLTGRA